MPRVAPAATGRVSDVASRRRSVPAGATGLRAGHAGRVSLGSNNQAVGGYNGNSKLKEGLDALMGWEDGDSILPQPMALGFRKGAGGAGGAAAIYAAARPRHAFLPADRTRIATAPAPEKSP